MAHLYSSAAVCHCHLSSAQAWSMLNGITQSYLPPTRFIFSGQSNTWNIYIHNFQQQSPTVCVLLLHSSALWKLFCSGRHTMFDFSAFTYRFWSQTVPVLSLFSVPDIVMRRRSICRRRTKSIVVFVVFVLVVTHFTEPERIVACVKLDSDASGSWTRAAGVRDECVTIGHI